MNAPTSRNDVVLILVPVALIIALAVLLAQWDWDKTTTHTVASGSAYTNSVGVEMALIPGGNYTMGRAVGEGAADELPPRQVAVAPFFLGRYEVTQAQWVAVMGDNPSRFRDPRRPVDNVSWLQAQEFVTRLNQREGSRKYRLPTEAEWEYAARAGTHGRWFFGTDPHKLAQYAWQGDVGQGGTHPVGKKAPNPWGLHDIYGNVWEWVLDCYHPSYQDAPPDSRPWHGGDCSLRVMRGGSWNGTPDYARAAVRGTAAPDLGDSNTGFRLASSP